MTSWLTNDIGGVIEEACSIVADIDIMGHGGGGPGGGVGRCRTERCTVGFLQRLAYGQGLCLEFRERVVAALWPRVHCKYHPLATMAGRFVRILLAMDPDGVPLVRNRSEGQLVPSCGGSV